MIKLGQTREVNVDEHNIILCEINNLFSWLLFQKMSYKRKIKKTRNVSIMVTGQLVD